MKAGILTYHFSENYGALFQAYALRQWFLNQGIETEFINYHPDYVEAGGEFNWLKPISKNNAKILFLKLTKLKENLLGNKLQKNNFEYFRKHGLGVKGNEFKTITEIEGASIEYDLLVCGSDQVWKPSEHYGVDPVYFLDFITKNKPFKISYAPSFGKDSLDNIYHNDVANLIRKLLDGVSVREESGCKIVENLTGLAPACVPDPTFLLSDYSQIMKEYPLKSRTHVFCYALRSREAIGDVAESIAKKLGAELYSPHNPHRRWKEIGKSVYPCPSQWLYLLSSSEYVVTNSFHGTALSIILNKPFVVIGLQGSKESFNARVKNLLRLVELESRFVQDVDSNTTNYILEKPINWNAVNIKIKELRFIGEDYLKKQISLLKND